MKKPKFKIESINKKIANYSTLSIAFLLLQNQQSSAEVEYFDVVPDTILANDLDAFVIDMNADGILDFGFWNFSYFTYDASSSFLLQRLWALPTDGNSIIGNLVTIASALRVYPYALGEGYLISELKPFQSHYFQRMAFRNYDYEWNGTSTVIDFSNAGGYWYPEVSDHFLGVRFLDEENKKHYGWIRCDVLNEGRTLIIKDYAYEIKPNVAIVAGDTIGDTTTIGITDLMYNEVNIYSYENAIYININNISALQNSMALIYDLSGNLVFSTALTSTQSKVTLDKKGLFVVTIINGREKISKSINLF